MSEGGAPDDAPPGEVDLADPAPEDRGPSGVGLARSGLSLVVRFARMEPLPFGLALFGGTAWAATVVGSTMVIGQVQDRAIVPVLAGDAPRSVALWAALALFAVGVLRGASVVLRRWYGSVTEAKVQAELRRQVADRVLAMPLTEHRRRPTGQLLAVADSDVTFSTWALMPVPLTFGLVALLVFSIISLLIADWTFALIAAVLFPALVVLSRWFSARMVEPATRSQEQVARVSGIAHESFEGALVVKTLGRERAESHRFEEAAGALRTQRLRLARLSSSYHPLVDALPLVGMVALIVVGASRVQAGAVSTGEVLAAVTLFGWLNFPVRVAGFLFESLPRSLVSMGRIESLLDTDTAPDMADHQRHHLPDGAPEVRFDGVSFAFEPGTQVLTDVNLTVAPGEVMALVGATGAGKTTLCELLVRLDEPTAGRVLLGGLDLAELSPSELRSTVALVFQESFLFATSLRDNVALGRRRSDDELLAVLARARARGFVEHLPEGLDTVMGERGVTLSGGQRQRVALARALVRRPRVLVLDDATSAVDPVVEAEILGGLRQETERGDGAGSDEPMTVLVVAHRLSTIRLADRVAFMEDGRVVAVGTHAQLLDHPGYEALVTAYEQEDATAGART